MGRSFHRLMVQLQVQLLFWKIENNSMRQWLAGLLACWLGLSVYQIDNKEFLGFFKLNLAFRSKTTISKRFLKLFCSRNMPKTIPHLLPGTGRNAFSNQSMWGPQVRPGPKQKKQKMNKKVSDGSSRAEIWSFWRHFSRRVFFIFRKSVLFGFYEKTKWKCITNTLRYVKYR